MNAMGHISAFGIDFSGRGVIHQGTVDTDSVPLRLTGRRNFLCPRRVSLVLMLGSKVVAMGKALTGMVVMSDVGVLDDGANVCFVRAMKPTKQLEAEEGDEAVNCSR